MLRNTSGFWIVVALALSSSLITPSWGRANERVTEFNIPPQALDSALLVFAEQADVQVSVSTVSIAGMKTHGVVGRFTPSVALARLLTETGLQFNTVGDRTYAVSLAGSSREKTTGAPGLLEAEGSKNADSTLQLAQGPEKGNTKVSAPPSAQQDDSSASQQDSAYLGDTVVIGSRLRRSEGEGPAPVITFDEHRIKQLGVTSVADVLNYLPQQSFASNEQSNFGGSRRVQLRGLGIGTTLVLINGRRTVTSALLGAGNVFDLNAIPLSAVERIEILADSASAVYGADAVGGVVNVVLKNRVQRPHVDLYYGTADAGGDERQAALALGYPGESFRASVLFDYFKRGLLPGKDRERWADQDFRRFGGTDTRAATANPGNVTSLTAANLPGLPSRFAAVPEDSTGIGLTPADFLSTAGQRNLESLRRFGSVVPETERASGVAFAEWDFYDQLTAFAEVVFVDRDDARFNTPASMTNRTVPAANPFNPFGVPVAVSYLFTGIGPREELSEAQSLRGVAGVRGDIGSWDWELSVLNIDDEGSNRTIGNVDTARVNAALASTDPTLALNVFQDGPGGSSSLLASLVAVPVVNEFSSMALQAGAFVRGPIVSLPAGALELVVGAETRREEVHFEAQPAIDISPDRHSSSAYCELRLPVVGSQMQVPALQRVTLTLAGRLDKYNDFGSTFNPQYGLEWTPISSLLLRASYGTSYRAPSLFELHQPRTARSTTVPDPRRNNETSPITLFDGGNPALEAEESDSLTLGFVFSPGEGSDELRIGVSYWTIEQDLRVQRFNALLILANEARFTERVVRADPTPADSAAGLAGRLVSLDGTSINFGRLETSGIDAQISDSFETSIGVFNPGLSATWVEKYDAADFPNTPAVERVGVANTQGTIPEWRAAGSLAWEWRGLGLSVTGRYVSSYEDADFFNVRTGRTVDSQKLLDFQGSMNIGELLSADWTEKLVVRVGVMNLLDEAPNFSEVTGLGFDSTQADTRQRFGYLSVSKGF